MTNLLCLLLRTSLTSIPISLMTTEATTVSKDEGWGGKSIHYFPPYIFYSLYQDGKRDHAHELMLEWYYNRFMKNKLYSVSKRIGGMKNGSLFRLVRTMHRASGIILCDDLSNADTNLILEGIRTRVKERFQLFEAIQGKQYDDSINFISLKKDKDHFSIVDGHHRIAAFALCGYSAVSGVLINNSAKFLLRVYSIVRKHGFCCASQ